MHSSETAILRLERGSASVEGMERPPSRDLTQCLICVECREGSDEEARGWRLFLLSDERVLLPYCPRCWSKEFGDSRRPCSG